MRFVAIRLRPIGVLMLAAFGLLFLLAGPAGAQGPNPETVTGLQVDTVTVVVLALAGAAIRPFTAFLLSAQADGGIFGIIAGLALAGVTTAGAALTDVGNIAHDWKTVVAAFLTTVIAAGAATAQAWSGKVVDWIHTKTDAWLGIGATPPAA